MRASVIPENKEARFHELFFFSSRGERNEFEDGVRNEFEDGLRNEFEDGFTGVEGADPEGELKLVDLRCISFEKKLLNLKKLIKEYGERGKKEVEESSLSSSC